MGEKSEAPQVEIITLDSATVEIRFHEGVEYKGYRGWKMPRSVAMLVAFWWKYRENDSENEKRFTNLIIFMPSSGIVDVKELDQFGHPRPAGWSLPVEVVAALARDLP